MPPILLGVYSSVSKDKIGSGTTSKKVSSMVHWLVRQMDEDKYRLSALGETGLPTKIFKTVTQKEFMSGFVPEPLFYIDSFIPLFQEYLGTCSMQQATVLLMNIGFKNLDDEAAQMQMEAILDELQRPGADLRREQRDHLNAFGILSRKSQLLNEALGYYQKSLELSPDNVFLLFNLARVYYELGNTTSAMECLEKALEYDPNFKEAKQFLNYLQKFKPKSA